jgi:hypothetical protein
MPLIHFNDSSGNDNFTQFDASSTNSIPLSYKILINKINNGSNIVIYDICNNDTTNNNKLTSENRYNILKKWNHTYQNYFQYLTL